MKRKSKPKSAARPPRASKRTPKRKYYMGRLQRIKIQAVPVFGLPKEI